MPLPRASMMFPVADRAGSPSTLEDWVDASWAPRSIRDFGAKVDGVSDDTAAWLAAYQDCVRTGGGVITMPAGTSNCASWPTFAVPILVVGQPGNVSKVHFTGAGACVTFDWTGGAGATNQYSFGPGLRDLVLDGTGSGGTQTGVTLGGVLGCMGFYGENVQVQNFGTGLACTNNSFLWTWVNSMFRANGTQLLGTSGATVAGENCRFIDCVFANANPLGNDLNNPAGSPFDFRFIGCSFDGVQVAQGGGNMEFVCCHFENPGTPGNYEMLVQTGGAITMFYADFRMNDVRSVNQFVHVSGGQFSSFGMKCSAQTAGMPQAVLADAGATVLMFGTMVLFNVVAEFSENGFHVATYVGSWGCVNGNGNANRCSADQGDASTSWTNGTSPEIIIFNTPLTAARTFTLRHTETAAGAAVRVVRTANATGAFNLTVQNQVPAAIKVLAAAGSWADFVFNGVTNAWIETASGTL